MSTPKLVNRITNILKQSESAAVIPAWLSPELAPTASGEGRGYASLFQKPLRNVLDTRATEAFEKAIEKSREKAETALSKATARSVKHSRTRLKVLREASRRHLQNLAAIAELPAAGGKPEYHLLDRPFLIWRSQGMDLVDSSVAPAASWAKFQASIGTAKTGGGNVDFYYLFENVRDTAVLTDIHGYIFVNGLCKVGTDGGIVLNSRYATAHISVTLTPLEWWNQPPSTPPFQTDQVATALSLHVNAGGFLDSSAFDERSVFRGFDLAHRSFPIIPRGVVVIKVTVFVFLDTGNGYSYATADFASADFQAGCPGVLVTTLT